MALVTSPESPAAVRTIASALAGWVDRLGWVWVEGQISQLNLRPGMVFLTLRDSHTDISIGVTCARAVIDASPVPVTQGQSVVVHAKPRYYAPRGSLSLAVDQIRPVGVGELLARIEQRRRLLAAEGLFAPELKQPLPFLPSMIGLVTARDSAAERDVLENARRRWPGVRFQVVHAVMQGAESARQVIAALQRLDADGAVDVIVIARGGGSVEDLLPFSDEGLIRAVAAARTPIVSAIGHEPDTPILDLVADLRASTPTDAAKRIVPDMADEAHRIAALRDRARMALTGRVDRERHGLAQLRSRPVLATPHTIIDQRGTDVLDWRDRARRSLGHRLDRADQEVAHQLARTRGLSPLATLERGYAVVQAATGHVLTTTETLSVGDALQVTLHEGRLRVRTEEIQPLDEGTA
ncbi:MAG: exodeoxyribonuclease VII large subunit [Nocardioidaceae bacterium]